MEFFRGGDLQNVAALTRVVRGAGGVDSSARHARGSREVNPDGEARGARGHREQNDRRRPPATRSERGVERGGRGEGRLRGGRPRLGRAEHGVCDFSDASCRCFFARRHPSRARLRPSGDGSNRSARPRARHLSRDGSLGAIPCLRSSTRPRQCPIHATRRRLSVFPGSGHEATAPAGAPLAARSSSTRIASGEAPPTATRR